VLFAPATAVPTPLLHFALTLLGARLVNPAQSGNLCDALAGVDGLPAVSTNARVACDDGVGDRGALLAVAAVGMHIPSPLRVAHDGVADTDWLAAARALALEPRVENGVRLAQWLLEVRPHELDGVYLVVGFGDIQRGANDSPQALCLLSDDRRRGRFCRSGAASGSAAASARAC
jgi:hypothetical protein